MPDEHAIRTPRLPPGAARTAAGAYAGYGPAMLDVQSPPQVPRPLDTPPNSGILPLVEAVLKGRLVLYLGAGVSIPAPAHGPKGADVANALRAVVSELLGVEELSLVDLDLEALSARVAELAPERLEELRSRAADAKPFRDMTPTYGHEVIALLLREGLATVVSANWDCGVERAGLQIETLIEGVSDDASLQGLPSRTIPLYKVHGCARRPQTLVLTRDEVDRPKTWAKAKVQDSLAAGTVVFVGLGTVGAYVGDSVTEVGQLWTDGVTTVRVVDPYGLSDAWRQVLGDHSDAVALELGSDEFLDDLLRAVLSRAISEIHTQARDLHQQEAKPWSQHTVEGLGLLRNAWKVAPPNAIVRWWRDGVTTDENGKRFILESGRTAVLCVAQLAGKDGSVVSATGSDGNLTVKNHERYFEVAARPHQHLNSIEPAVMHRIALRRRSGIYSPGIAVTVVIPGASGAFPSDQAPSDISAGDAETHSIAIGDDEMISFVRAEDALSGRLAA